MRTWKFTNQRSKLHNAVCYMYNALRFVYNALRYMYIALRYILFPHIGQVLTAPCLFSLPSVLSFRVGCAVRIFHFLSLSS